MCYRSKQHPHPRARNYSRVIFKTIIVIHIYGQVLTDNVATIENIYIELVRCHPLY